MRFLNSAAENLFPSLPPSAPPFFKKNVQKPREHCSRFVHFNGKKINCDSFIGKDGENLRSLLQATPSAITQLDLYQRNQKEAQKMAYFGTAGLTSILISRVFLPQTRSPSGNLTAGGWLLYGGLGLTTFALAYGIHLLFYNENHLFQAIDLYNQDHPQSLIQWN